MRVAVLGGTRFIGRALVPELLAAGHEVLVVHRGEHEPQGLPETPHLHVHRRELRERASELAAFSPMAVVDLSAMTRADADAALAAFGHGVRLLVASSADVYRAFGSLWSGATTDPVPLDEASPLRDDRPPDHDRSSAGWDVEPGEYEKRDVEDAYRERQATVCRLPFVYGEHDYQRREEFILRRVRAGREQIPIGAATWLGSRGYVGDIAVGLRLALESDAAGEVFNLGEETTPSIGLWAADILRAAGSSAELVRVPEERLPEDLDLTGSQSQHLLLDSSKARSKLGWRPRPAEETVLRSVRWHLEHPPEGDGAGFEDDDRALKRAAGR